MKEDRPPRILWVSRYCLLDTSSGGSISVYEILKQLNKRKWKIEILGATIFDSDRGTVKLKNFWSQIKNSESPLVNIIDDALTHRLIKTTSLKSNEMTLDEVNRWTFTYINFLDEFKPDLVFFYGGNAAELIIAHEARIRNIPSVAYLVNENYQGNRWCRDVDLIITDTHATSKFYQKREGFIPVPVGKFIDRSNIVVSTNSRKTITFINPALAKGAAIVALLAIYLEKKNPKIIFNVIQSRGDWNEVVCEIFKANGEEPRDLKNVIVTKHTDDIKTVYENTRVLLVPSLWWESGARVIAEAMLNGIPIIATDYGGNKEMAAEGGIYFTLPPEMHVKPYDKVPKIELLMPIAEKIEQLYNDEIYYQKYVSRAYEVGRRQHNIDVSTERFLNVIKPLIERRAGDNDHAILIDQIHKQLKLDKTATQVPLVEDSLTVPLLPDEHGLFIDCGGYDGCSAVKFILKNPDFDSITFEPNPELWTYYSDVPTMLIKKAAYTHDGTVSFTIDETDADGSTIIESKKVDYWGKVPNEDCPKIVVECTDLGKVISTAAEKYQKIVLKLDIEGAEYDVLEKLLDENLIKHITVIFAEFHWQKCGFAQSRHIALLEALKKQTIVAEWDALDYAIHKQPLNYKNNRSRLISEKIKDLSKYKSVKI